ncbi:hypothetical protein, partial [Enterococcus faecium]|uniref:hypothetical protein n=1 Tax=Enterococcus faecium TaxID=1352 RepID=UPI003DA0B155
MILIILFGLKIIRFELILNLLKKFELSFCFDFDLLINFFDKFNLFFLISKQKSIFFSFFYLSLTNCPSIITPVRFEITL